MMKTNLLANPFRKAMAVLLTLLMLVTLLPSNIAKAEDDTEPAAVQNEEQPQQPVVIQTENGEVIPEDNWNEVYPYGTFAFGSYQADVAEQGARTSEGEAIPQSILIPVHRLGGTVGRATVRIIYAPAITTNEDGTEKTYDYAASGKSDMLIEFEDANPIAAYQPLGIPEGQRTMQPSEIAVVLPEAPENVMPEDELTLTLSGETVADAYRWQVKREDGWQDIDDAEAPELNLCWEDVWDFEEIEPKGYDFRCVMKIGSEIVCSVSMLGEVYEPIADPDPIPEDLVIPEEPTYSVLSFEDEWDVMEFEMTFADGETVKYIRITAIEDELPELPEFGLFTISGCEGGVLSDTCNTLTVMVSDNDTHTESEVGFAEEAITANREDGYAKARIDRSGDTTYNVTMHYETVDGTAVAGVDYAKAEGEIAFAGSIDSIEIPVELIANDETEDKTFDIVLSELKGGGTEDLCKFAGERVTVTITGKAKAPADDGSGQNLASLLNGANGTDVSGKVSQSSDALIGGRDDVVLQATTVAQEEEGLEATFEIEPATRSHPMGAYYKFTRGRTSSNATSDSTYSDSFWRDWDDLVGCSENVYRNMDVKRSKNENFVSNDWWRDDKPSGSWMASDNFYHRTVSYNNSTYFYDTGRADANYKGKISYWWDNSDHYAGEYFDKLTMSFGWVLPGVRHVSGLLHMRYLRPELEITIGSWSDSKMFDVDTDTDNMDWRPDNWEMYCRLRDKNNWQWESAYYTPGYDPFKKYSNIEGPSLGYEEDFNITMYFKYYLTWTHRKATTYHKDVTSSDHTSVFDVRAVSGHRRVFSKTSEGINLILYTVNDSDTANGYTVVKDENIYKKLAPVVSIVSEAGGVNKSNDLYVGTTLKFDFTQAPTWFVIPTDGIHLLDGQGREVGTMIAGGNRTYTCKMMPSRMDQSWQDATFTLHICYERVQKVYIDVGPSSERIDDSGMAISWETADAALGKLLTYAGTNGVTGVTATLKKGTNASNLYNTVELGSVNMTSATQFEQDENVGFYKFKTAVTNLQSINFHQDPDDVILYNDSAYAGNQDIPILEKDFNGDKILFSFYDSEYLDAMSIMAVLIDHVEVYYDGDHNGQIDGELDNNYFFHVDTENSKDEFIMYAEGDYPDGTFKPQTDPDHNLYQYYFKVYFKKRARAYNVPVGYSADQSAQILPAFASAITDSDAASSLTKEQSEYRYVKANDTDGKLMFGALASGTSTVDIPLGGDLGSIEMHSEERIVYEKDGTTPKDTEKVISFTWDPAFAGNLLVNYNNPAPITDKSNVTGHDVELAGEDPTELPDGSLTLSQNGIDNLNQYLGAFLGRSTFLLGIQEQEKPYLTVTDLDDIDPESISFGEVRCIPNSDSLVNTQGSDSPGETDGTSPQLGDFDEFQQDLGVELPSLELGLGDYATIIMDGYQVGFAVGIPIYKNEKAENFGSERDQGTTSDGYNKSTYTDDDGVSHEKYEKTDPNTKKKTTTDVKTVTDPNDPNKRTKTIVTTTEDEHGNKHIRTETRDQEKHNDKWVGTHKEVTDQDPTTPSKREKAKEGFKEANGQMCTLGGFISACGKGKGGDFFKDAFKDDTFDAAKNGNAASKKVSVSFTVQIAIMFEYNPIDNCHYFKSAGLSATLGFEFTLQLRFTPCPVFYVYFKLGVEIEAGISLTCYRNAKDGDEIKTFVKGLSLYQLSTGKQIVFELDMRDDQDNTHRGFHIDLNGEVMMKVYSGYNADGPVGSPLTLGMLKGDGGQKEVLLKDYNAKVYVELTPHSKTVEASNLTPIIGAESKVVFDGLTITPGISVEAGVGAGIELLKIEAFFKISTSMAMTMGGYLEETDSYEGFYISGFEGSMAVGVNITALFFNFTLDAIAFGFEGEQHGTGGYFSWHISCTAVNGTYELWSTDCYTSADGKTLSGEPQPPEGVNIFKDNDDMTFYRSDGTEVTFKEGTHDLDPKKQGWTFRTDVLAWRWKGGVFLGEIPQNADLAEADEDNVSVVFETDQQKIDLYFSGKIKVHNSRTNTTKTYESSPAKLDFGAGTGNVTVKVTCEEGTKLDRYENAKRSIGNRGRFVSVTEGNGNNLVHVTGPTDISKTQKVVSPTEDTRAITPTGTDDFQLSGYNTTGDAKLLVGGLTTGYDYKLVQANGENYIVYPLMVDGVPQIVLSRIVLTGNLAEQAGLVHPTDATQSYLLIDNDGLTDHDFDVEATDDGLLVSWVSYADDAGTTFAVKQREISLAEGAETTVPVVLSTGEDMLMLPQAVGAETIWISADGDGEADNEALRAWLIATHDNEDLPDALDNMTTTDPSIASVVFTWNTQSFLNAMNGDKSVLHVIRGEEELTAEVAEGEHIHNIETKRIGTKTYVLFTTAQVAYFDTTAEEGPHTVGVDGINADTEQANIYRLYLMTLDDEGFSEPLILKTVLDNSNCSDDTLASAILKDGIYVDDALETPQADPYFANLKFVTADIDNTGVQTLALFEMNGNTWLLKQADIDSLLAGGSAELIPIFKEVTGTEVAIGSDEFNMNIVYTAPISNSLSNAIFISWWDKYEQCWGTPTILAMRNLQIYEDRITYDMSAEDAEKAYLGDLTTEGGHTGSKDRLTFTNLQTTTRLIESDDGTTKEQLVVLTNGAMTKLTEHTFEMEGKDDFTTYIPDGNAEVGFYAIAFGAGEQAVGEASIELASYDFAVGSKLTGTVSFRNTGTAAIRASDANPLTITLIADRSDGAQELATWQLIASIPSGALTQLGFEAPALTQPLHTDDSLQLRIVEDSYFEPAFSTTIEDLLVVKDMPELMLGDFDASVIAVDEERASIQLTLNVINAGSVTAENVFLQFSYDTGTFDDNGDPIYYPVDITGSKLETSVQHQRGADADARNGIYRLSAEDGTDIDSDYYRVVTGTLKVPKECFINTETKSGLHLKIEAYSDSDTPNLSYDVYNSEHNEYNEDNNRIEKTFKHVTVFNVANRINTALGTTLTLPVSFSTTGAAPDIVLTEISDGTENWEPRMGVCYYDADRQVIVAAPNTKAQELINQGIVPTGILQIKDMNTNSIAAITYKVSSMADGVNIYRDDTSFSFRDPNGTATDLYAEASSNPAWLFLDKNVELGWTGGAPSEIPMNNDLSLANADDAYFTFVTVADTITFYFMGEITVESELMDPETATQSPAKFLFHNESGETHTVKVTCKKGTRIDRYAATYRVSPVIDADPEAPMILWNRNFPDPASLKKGEDEITLTCYIVDSTGIRNVMFNEEPLTESTTPALVKVSDNFWYFNYTFTENATYSLRAYDLSGNTTAGSVNVRWFNDLPSTSANADAPGLLLSDLEMVDDDGEPVGTGQINITPWLESSYELREDEESEARMLVEGAFSGTPEQAEGEQRWLIMANGIYVVYVYRADGTWARAIVEVDNLDLTKPQLSLRDVDGAIEITASDDNAIESLTVNGYPIPVIGKMYLGLFEIALGGTYEVTVTDNAGNSETKSIDAVVPVTFKADKEITCANGDIKGSLVIERANVKGGEYKESISDPANNVYATTYEYVIVAGEAEEAPETGWAVLTDDVTKPEELGTYTVFVRDAAHNTGSRVVQVVHDFEWDVQEYIWTETANGYSVTGTAICTHDETHIVTETVDATYEVITPPTTRKDGLGRFTATFTDDHFTTQTKDVVIPQLQATFYGEDVTATDTLVYEDGKTYYRYDIKIKNVDREYKAVSCQIFVAYDTDMLRFSEARTNLEGMTGVSDLDGVIGFSWATGDGCVPFPDGLTVVSLYFEAAQPIPDGTVLPFVFEPVVNGFANGLAYLGALDDTVEADPVYTEDGSITFEYPKMVTLAGEEVKANDTYRVVDGELQYRYDIRVRDLPAAGLLVNSAQIFVSYDRSMLAFREAEGIVDWIVSDNATALLAAWASDTEVLFKNEDVVLTLWFAGTQGTQAEGRAEIRFTVNALSNGSELSAMFAGNLITLDANTVDGGITFEAYLFGDANCDGTVTSADAALILRSLVMLSELTPRGMLFSDVDGDGEVTAADAALILRLLVGLIDSFPVENP